MCCIPHHKWQELGSPEARRAHLEAFLQRMAEARAAEAAQAQPAAPPGPPAAAPALYQGQGGGTSDWPLSDPESSVSPPHSPRAPARAPLLPRSSPGVAAAQRVADGDLGDHAPVAPRDAQGGAPCSAQQEQQQLQGGQQGGGGDAAFIASQVGARSMQWLPNNDVAAHLSIPCICASMMQIGGECL